MSKRPTPKKQVPKSAGKKRYASFVLKSSKNLMNKVNLTSCSSCKRKIPVHMACPTCGKYRGKEILSPSSSGADQITKIAA
jgi:ribosomal protein L32